jgi:GTPase SAR1 family protein
VYYKEAVGAMIVFDVTRVSTFEAVAKWKADIDAKVTYGADEKPIPVVLLANKCDLAKEGFVKTANEMDKYVKENNFLSWFETSAKDNINIDKAAKCLVAHILDNDIRRIAPTVGTVKPGTDPKPEENGGCCK